MYHTNLTLKDPFFDTKSNWSTMKQIFTFFLLILYSGVSLTAQNTFFVSSNTQQSVGVFDVRADGAITESIFFNNTSDADGIYYDETTDVLYQLNRSDGTVVAYNNVKSSLANNNNPPFFTRSAAETINGREMAVSGNRLVIAQDANAANDNQNRFIVFDISPTEITLVARYEVDFDL